MRSTSIFPCIMAMISNFTIFFIFKIFILNFFLTNIKLFFAFAYDSWSSFVNNFIFFFLNLIIFIACSLKDSQNFFRQSLPLYTLCLFSMVLNDDIVYKPYGMCSLTFVVNAFRALFLHTSIFSIEH